MRRRGISPVIATVILVAVAIAVAIAVAFWMTGIIGIFTGRVEQLEVVSATADWYDTGLGGEATAQGYYVVIVIKNTGTSPVTVDGVFITPSDTVGDNTDIYSYSETDGWQRPTNPPGINDVNPSSSLRVEPGGSVKIAIGPLNGEAGQSIEVKIHSAGGKEYPKLVVLP